MQNPPSKNYAAGTYTVSLTVTDAGGLTSTTSKTLTVTATNPTCIVPDFKNLDTSDAIQTQWQAAGFDTTVIFNPLRPPEYKIKGQSIAKGQSRPCSGTVITVTN